MRKPKPPCKDCAKKQLRCHAMCIEYAAFCYDNEAYKKKVFENKSQNNALDNIGVRRTLRAKKASGYHS